MLDVLYYALLVALGVGGAILLGTLPDWSGEFRREGLGGAWRYFRTGYARRDREWIANNPNGARTEETSLTEWLDGQR